MTTWRSSGYWLAGAALALLAAPLTLAQTSDSTVAPLDTMAAPVVVAPSGA